MPKIPIPCRGVASYYKAKATKPRRRLPALPGAVSKPAALEVVGTEVDDVVISIVLVCRIVDVVFSVDVEVVVELIIVDVLVDLGAIRKFHLA